MLTQIAETFREVIHKNGPLPLAQRRARLMSLKEAIEKNETQIAEALFQDLGKSHFEAYVTEIGFVLDEIKITLKNLDRWSQDKKVKTPVTLFPGSSYIRPEPYGVVLIISPWNYPFQLSLAPLVGAIASGNRVVLKPSEISPQTTAVTHKILLQVFKEDEVFVAEGGAETSEALLRQRFDYIFFTGSTGVGKIVMKAAAEHLTPVTLELGGKSPCLIEESANLSLSAKRVVWGKFLNAGQTCVAPDYVLIPRKLQDQFIIYLRQHLQDFYGSDLKKSLSYSKIINEKHFDRLEKLIIGEKVVVGNELDRANRFIHPTVMKDVTFADKIMADEIFGPLLPIIPFDTLEEALSLIAKRPKPLAFYLFSENSQRQDEIMRRVSFGGACINDTVIHLANPHLPFGGVGESGMGSYHGQKSFDTFSHHKAIFKRSPLVDIPLRYPPYGSSKLKWIKKLLG